MKGWSRFEKGGKDTRWQHEEKWRRFCLLALNKLQRNMRFSSDTGIFLALHQERHSQPLEGFLKAVERVRQHKEDGHSLINWNDVTFSSFPTRISSFLFSPLSCSTLLFLRIAPDVPAVIEGDGSNLTNPSGHVRNTPGSLWIPAPHLLFLILSVPTLIKEDVKTETGHGVCALS